MIILSLLTVLAFATLLSLSLATEGPNQRDNGFRRQVSSTAGMVHRRELRLPVTGVCAMSGDSLFLSSKVPGVLYLLTGNLAQVDTVKLRLPGIPRLSPVFYTMLQWPQIYILAGNARKLMSGNFQSGTVTTNDIADGPFGNGTMVGSNCFVVRALDTATVSARFLRLDSSGKVTAVDSGISAPLHDAGFTHDGMLSYDWQSRLLVYLDYYSNQLTVFDTALRLVYRGRTIDTTGHSPVITGKKGKKLMANAPVMKVNRFMDAEGGVLYVVSNLKGDNERQSDFRKVTAVDRYRVKDNRYLGSFYLPVPNDRRLRGFSVWEGKCIVLYDNEIIIMEMI